jgi:hypothetical protein
MQEYDFRPIAKHTLRARSLSSAARLWVLKTDTHPPRDMVHAYLGKGMFIVRSVSLVEYTGHYAPLEAVHKHRPGLNTTLGVVVRCIDAHSAPHGLGAQVLSARRVFIPGPLDAAQLRYLGSSHNVLWIDAVKPLAHHALASRRALFLAAPADAPQGGRMMVSDTALDTSHCAFGGGAYSNGTLSLSGALPSLPDLGGKILGVVRVEYSPGAYTDPAPTDGTHGTATAGAAVGQVCAGESGVAPGARLLFVALQGPGGGLYVPPDLGSAYALAASMNVSVHSMSWGSTYADGEYDDYSHQTDEYARQYDVANFYSAGNSGPGLASSPATGKNGASVGAALSAAADFPGFSAQQRAAQPELYAWDSVASFSSVGPLADGRRAPTLVAPGVAVVVPYAFALAAPGHTDMERASGTSFAGPAAAAAAAAAQQTYFEATGQRMSAALTLATMIAAARPTTRVVAVGQSALMLAPGADMSFGFPLLDLPSMILQDRLESNYSMCFNATGPTMVAIVWQDPAAFPFAKPTLINDLDLFVVVGGVEYTGNDHLDNKERVVFNATGPVRVVVRSNGMIHDGAQLFGLAISGGVLVPGDCGACLLTDRDGLCLDDGTLAPLPDDAGPACPTDFYPSAGTCVCFPARACAGSAQAASCVDGSFSACAEVEFTLPPVVEDDAGTQAGLALGAIGAIVFAVFVILVAIALVGMQMGRGGKTRSD